MAKKVSWDKQAKLLLERAEAYALHVERILDKLADDALDLVLDTGYDGSKFFRFSDHPDVEKRFEKLQRKSAQDIRTIIENGATEAWGMGNAATDTLVAYILGNKASLAEYKGYFGNNHEALNSFLTRRRKGLNLSQRIWNLESGFKDNLESAITVAIGDGTSAAQLSREIRKYLHEPDRLFRRIAVYNDTGDLKRFKLSKPALRYNPGLGQYKSSYMNAMRLAASEINMAYRKAEQTRWLNLDFVVGYEVKRSGINPYPCPTCEALKGVYPKTFVFPGWHPWCMCFCVPILKTDEEMDRDDALIMSGQEPLPDSANLVSDIPDNFKEWIAAKTDSILQARRRGTLPYFLLENDYAPYLKKK